MEQNRDHRNKPIHVVIYNKGAKNIQWKEDSLVNKGVEKSRQPHEKKNEPISLANTTHKN